MEKSRGDSKKVLEKNLTWEKTWNLRILNSVTVPKNVKGGRFGFFQHPICCKIEGGPFGSIQKFSKKSLSTEKNPNEKHQDGGLQYVFEVLVVGFFVFGWVSDV